MRVIVSLEYDVDVEDLDPIFIDIEGFAKDEAKRMFEDDLKNNTFEAEDFDYTIPSTEVIPPDIWPPLGISGEELREMIRKATKWEWKDMAVAKSFQSLIQQGEPYSKSGRMYVKLINEILKDGIKIYG